MTASFPPVIGKYKISGIIAKGGMGVVYKAVHPSLRRYVVIKKMTARGNSIDAERFKREAQILLDLQSPYIVHLYDYFTESEYRYIVEELVDGMALDKLIEREKKLPPQLTLLILQDACLALRCAHQKGIIHRDIKPGNILISKRAEIKLADFGIASGEKEAGNPSLTRSGLALGTPAYMPPEQFENSSKVDQRADIYSLGVMTYEIVTGTKPFPGTLSVETLDLIRKGKYEPPRSIDSEIPLIVCRLIKKMLRPYPRRRFQSVDPIIRIIRRYLRHYDVHALRVELARSILAPESYIYKKIQPKDLVPRRIGRILLAAVVVAVVFVYLWYSGCIYRTVLRHFYTPVTVEMAMPPAAAAGSDLPVKAFFFVNDGADIPEVPHTRRIFTEKEVPAVRNKMYGIKPVYLRQGNYRMKVAAGPYIWWQSFTVTEKEKPIYCDFLEDARRPIKIQPYASDHGTGQDITGKAVFSLLYNGSWRKLDDIPTGTIVSGTVWKIRVSSAGYKDEIFSLLIDWYQDEVFISADLNRSG
jgi:eukaryotic-like serine/threonine-protein kinase